MRDSIPEVSVAGPFLWLVLCLPGAIYLQKGMWLHRPVLSRLLIARLGRALFGGRQLI